MKRCGGGRSAACARELSSTRKNGKLATPRPRPRKNVRRWLAIMARSAR
jgi:hypothetical protein